MYVDGFSECLFEAGNVKPSQSAPANESGTSGGRGLIRGEQLVRAINASPVAYVWCFDLKGKFDSDSVRGTKRLELHVQISGGFRVEWFNLDMQLEAECISVRSNNVHIRKSASCEPAFSGYNNQVSSRQEGDQQVHNYDYTSSIGTSAQGASPLDPASFHPKINGTNQSEAHHFQIHDGPANLTYGLAGHRDDGFREGAAESPVRSNTLRKRIGSRELTAITDGIVGRDQEYELADLEHVTVTQPNRPTLTEKGQTIDPMKYTWIRECVRFVEVSEHNVVCNEWGRPTVPLCNELIGPNALCVCGNPRMVHNSRKALCVPPSSPQSPTGWAYANDTDARAAQLYQRDRVKFACIDSTCSDWEIERLLFGKLAEPAYTTSRAGWNAAGWGLYRPSFILSVFGSGLEPEMLGDSRIRDLLVTGLSDVLDTEGPWLIADLFNNGIAQIVSEALARQKKFSALESSTRRRRPVSLGIGRQFNSKEHILQVCVGPEPKQGHPNSMDAREVRTTNIPINVCAAEKNEIEASHCTHVIFLEDGTHWDTDMEHWFCIRLLNRISMQMH